ncbi:MAG: hypothetical protein GC157_00950 [Frankiales bacterium]|nr:hypothetical protein [Frankiales bacterium]
MPAPRTRVLAATALALALSALLPATRASAAPADCATTLAPVLAASDAELGYSGVVRLGLGSDRLEAWSIWNSVQVAAAVHVRLSSQIPTTPPFTVAIDTSAYDSTRAEWVSLNREDRTRDEARALVLLHRREPVFLENVGRRTPEQVHLSTAWPSHDVASVLPAGLPVTATAPGTDGGTVYTCSDAGTTLTAVVDPAGRLERLTGTLPAGSVGGPALTASLQRQVRSAVRHGSATATTDTESVSLAYTYGLRQVRLPSAARSVTETMLRRAIESLHLRASVRSVADAVSRAAKLAVTPRHPHVTVADLVRLAAGQVRRYDARHLVPLRAGTHPTGVWIAATDPFSGGRIAYSVLVVNGTSAVHRVA